MKTHHLFDLFNWVWFLFILAVIIGIISKPAIYDYISFTIKLMVSFFLMYKFNDFRTLGVFTELDKRICFMAGTNLFLITCGDYVNKVVEFTKEEIKKVESNLFKK
jgi:hypothetical protein